MAGKERGASRMQPREARVERERMARSCVPAHAWSEGTGKKEPRVSLTSQILITRDHPRILVRVTRPCARGQIHTRENSAVYTRIYTVKIALRRGELRISQKIRVARSETEN